MDLTTAIITLLVGAAVFITGMSMMSSGLKKATGKSLRRIFKKTQNNAFACFGIGAGVTALVQSSSATCVLAVGFINAGLMSLYQGMNIMLGSFVGTSVTGLLVSLSSFDISIWLTLLAFVGVVMMFFKNEKVKNIGQICCGLGLIFFGLDSMSGAFKGSTETSEFFQNLFTTIDFPLLLLVFGVLLTALIQSSSATTGLVIVMVGSGAISFASAMYIVLGATIGTCVTTMIAVIGGSVNAKRSAVISLIVKLIAALLAIAIIWPLQSEISSFFSSNFGSLELGLALFTIMYAVLFFPVMIPLMKPLIKLSEKIVKDKDEENKKHLLKYIDNQLLKTPDIALMEVKNEIINMHEMAMTNFKHGYAYLVKKDESNISSMTETESNIDYINNEITQYLISLSNRVSSADSKIVGAYFHVINDIERIGDHAYNFYENSKRLEENELAFSKIAIKELQVMYDLIMEMNDLAVEIFKNEDSTNLKHLHELEDKSDVLAKELETNHYKRMTANECSGELSDDYATLVSELERVADHLTNIGYSIVNPTGDEQLE